MLTWKIGAEEDAIWSNKFIHSRKSGFVCTQGCLVIKTLEVLQDFVMCQWASHVSGKNGDSRSQEWRASAHMCEYNFDMRIPALLARDDKVGGGFKGFVWDLK